MCLHTHCILYIYTQLKALCPLAATLLLHTVPCGANCTCASAPCVVPQLHLHKGCGQASWGAEQRNLPRCQATARWLSAAPVQWTRCRRERGPCQRGGATGAGTTAGTLGRLRVLSPALIARSLCCSSAGLVAGTNVMRLQYSGCISLCTSFAGCVCHAEYCCGVHLAGAVYRSSAGVQRAAISAFFLGCLPSAAICTLRDTIWGNHLRAYQTGAVPIKC